MISIPSIRVPHRGRDSEISCFVRLGKGETLVYLHGLGSTKYDFWGATSEPGLSDATLVALDFPGCGNSNYFDAFPLGMDDLVEITHKVVVALQLEDLTLMGHSMGGLVAVLFAERYPQLVKRLVSVEGNLAPEDCFISRVGAGRTFQEFVEQDLIGQWQKQYSTAPYVGSRIYADQLRRNVRVKACHDYCRSIVEQSNSGRLLPAFLKLKIPRLFVHGSGNRSLSYIPQLGPAGVRVVEVPGAHHWLVADNPNIFFRTIGEFVSGGESAATTQRAVDWVFNLDDASQGIRRELAEGVNTRIFPGEHAMLSVVRLEPHSQGKVHIHAQEQWGVLLRGECVRIQDGAEVPVKPGDFWRTPGNSPHGMRAGAKGAVVLDIFSPPRPEYAKPGKGFGPGSEEHK